MPKEDRRRGGDGEDFFDRLSAEFDDLRERMDRVLDEFMSGKLGDQGPLVYGLNLRVGPDGVPNLQEFGNATPLRSVGGEKALLREPLTDIIESEDQLTVIMELPGVDKSEIKVSASDRLLELRVDRPAKRFSRQLELPCDILADSAQASYKNGVLQIVMRRAVAKKKPTPIEVE